jgi:hypothetical protein
MTACGVWLAPRGLVAVLVDDSGRARACSVAFTDDARSGLALWLAAAGADLVIDETILEADPIADVARRAGVTVWIAGPPLVEALRHAAGITRRLPVGLYAAAAIDPAPATSPAGGRVTRVISREQGRVNSGER